MESILKGGEWSNVDLYWLQKRRGRKVHFAATWNNQAEYMIKLSDSCPKPNRSPAQRVRFGKEEQRRERALTFAKKVGASFISLAPTWNIKTLWMPVRIWRICFMDILQGHTDCGDHKGWKSTIFALNRLFHFFHYVAWESDGFVDRRWRGWYLKSAHRFFLAIHLYCN